MKRIPVLFAAILLFTLSGWAQNQNCGDQTASYTNCRNAQTVSTSGQSITINNYVGAVTASFELTIAGSPSTVSVTIQGCMRGGTCDTLDTYTTVANSIRKPTISTVYDKFVITASWTGGSSPAVTVNTNATIARNSSGGGSVAVNGSQVTSPNFNGSSPSPDAGYFSCTYKASGSSVIAECPVVTSSMVDTSIAVTGGDINTSSQVVATHLNTPLSLAQGGMNAANTAPSGYTPCGTGTAYVDCEPGIPTNNITAAGAYAVLGTDKGKVVKCSTSCTGFTIAQGGTGSFDAAYYVYLKNNLATPIVLTPATSTCNAAATCTISPGQLVLLTVNEANNYRVDYFVSHPDEHVVTFNLTKSGNCGVFIPATFSGTIYAWSVTADQSGSFAMDIWKKNNAIPAAADKISGTGNGPALSSAQSAFGTAPSSWGSTTVAGTVAAPDVFGCTVTTFTTVTNVTVTLYYH